MRCLTPHPGLRDGHSDRLRKAIRSLLRQFTSASVDRDLLERAKVIAAKRDTSVDALLNAELRHIVETCEASRSTGNQNFATLLDFSLGRVDDLTALGRLSLDNEEDLFLLMAPARLPMPRLSDSAARSMVEALAALPR